MSGLPIKITRSFFRNDPRVVVMEKTNARYLKRSDFPVQPDLATIDVSFISLDKILPAVSKLLSSGGEAIALIKPQFETGPKYVKKGVIKDPAIHNRVIERIKKQQKKTTSSRRGLSHLPYSGLKGIGNSFYI